MPRRSPTRPPLPRGRLGSRLLRGTATAAPVAVVLVDQGTAADQLLVAAAAPLTDTGVGADTLGVLGPEWTPDRILQSTNLAVTDPVLDARKLWDDPTAADASWLAAVDAEVSADLRVSFPTPTLPPGGGGPLEFAVRLRRTAAGTDPQVRVELWEAGLFRATLTTATITSTVGQTVTATMNPADLADPTGAGVELRLSGGGGDLWSDTWTDTW